VKIISFWAPRPDHPHFHDYTPYLDLLRESCLRYGHEHVVLTDDPSVGPDAYVRILPHNLMLAYLVAQHSWLSDPANADTPCLLTGADCVLAQDPSVFAELCGGADILVTSDPTFLDCRINMGAIYIPTPSKVVSVWRDAIQRCKGEWGDDQIAFAAALEASDLSVVDVPCDPYNLAPEHPGDDCRRGVVLHFRSDRKAWMTAYCREWLDLGPGIQVKVAPNTDDETAIAQIKVNLAGGYTELQAADGHAGCAVLVGSGPSVADDFEKIKHLAAEGATIFALNGAAGWLAERGVVADYGVMLDMREGNTKFIRSASRDTTWLIASHCHPAVFKEATRLKMYHFGAETSRPHLPNGAMLIGGGPTVGLTAMVLAVATGFRELRLFGYDSSFSGNELHVKPQSMTEDEARRLDVWVDGLKFHTNIAMYAQAASFQDVCRSLLDAVPDVHIAVHGRGLLPTIAQVMARDATQTAAEAA